MSKSIIKFEEFIKKLTENIDNMETTQSKPVVIVKKFGQAMPLSEVNVDDIISYTGSPCKVIEVNPYVIKVQNINTEQFHLINQSMFDAKCMVTRDE